VHAALSLTFDRSMSLLLSDVKERDLSAETAMASR